MAPAYVKTQRTGWQKEQILTYGKLKIIFQEVEGSEEGMRTVTKESMRITHIRKCLTEGDLGKGASKSLWK